MEETFNTKAIILNRQPYKETDSRVIAYTLEKGKLELIARGAQKLSSKLAAHIEPLNLVDLMVIKGRKRNYAGSVIGQDSFADIKKNLDKIHYAGLGFKIFNQLVRENEADAQLFNLLLNFLETLRVSREEEFIYSVFLLKLLAELGYKPEIYHCVNCKSKIQAGNLRFNLAKGGLICPNCAPALLKTENNHILTISDECVKLIRFVLESDWQKISRFKIENKNLREFDNLINKIINYN